MNDYLSMGSSTIKVNAFSFHDLSDSANSDDDDDDEEHVVGKAEPETRSKRPRAPLVHPRARARSELARPKARDVGVSDTSTACRRRRPVWPLPIARLPETGEFNAARPVSVARVNGGWSGLDGVLDAVGVGRGLRRLGG